MTLGGLVAGESRGELAEAIAKVAVEEALRKAKSREQVFWEETPDAAAIKPDVTTGYSKNIPSNVILVNASDSPKNSDMKFWRNIGEIFDCKTRLDPRPTVITLFFKSEIKPELIALTSALCDASHLVDRDPNHGAAISAWLEGNHGKAPSKKADKERLVRDALNSKSPRYVREFAIAFRDLVSVVNSKLFVQRRALKPLWDLGRNDLLGRMSCQPREARLTLLRRGVARWLVFDEKTRARVLDAHYRGRGVPRDEVPEYALLLGLLTLSVAGGVIPGDLGVRQNMVGTAGTDLRLVAQFFRDAAHGDGPLAREALKGALDGIPDEMRRVAARLRETPMQVAAWQHYAVEHWKSLSTAEGLLDALNQCSIDATMGGSLTVPREFESNWLYEHLVAILRASSGRNNDFGYGALVAHFKSRQTDPAFRRFMEKVIRGLDKPAARGADRWLRETLPGSAEPGRRGFQDWLAGKKDVAQVIVAAFAYALAGQLADVRRVSKVSLSGLVAAHSYGLWNKLLTYPDFEPLPVLVATACGSRVSRVAARTVMADLAERAVQDAGCVTALAFRDGLICWKSVTDAGKDHKRKELTGRARALRFTRNDQGFGARPSAKKLFLVIDGTFDSSDLAVLLESGWDEIFYPDEMDKLVKAIL